MEKEISNYQLKIPIETMEKFKGCLRKVYWKKGITINDAIIKLIGDFIEQNDE